MNIQSWAGDPQQAPWNQNHPRCECHECTQARYRGSVGSLQWMVTQPLSIKVMNPEEIKEAEKLIKTPVAEETVESPVEPVLPAKTKWSCPVCDWPNLDEDPALLNYNICQQCGVEFGYEPKEAYAKIRHKWEEAGRPFWFNSTSNDHKMWNKIHACYEDNGA